MLKSKLKGKSMWYYIKSVMNIVLGLTLVVFLPLIVMLVADCEVAGLKRSKLGSILAYEYELCEKDEICHESWVLPESLKAKQTYPLVLSYEPILTAINANDSRLLTFTEIADVLESICLGDGTKAEKILVTMYKKKKNWVMEDSIKGKMRKGFASLKADFERASIY